MKFNVFSLGDDLWLWKSPYSLNWIFHHPKQNFDRPDDTDSIIIIVKNDNLKIVGLQRIKWNDKGQIIYKNSISYKYVKCYNYQYNNIAITQSLVLEHEIIEITHGDRKDLFKRIKREYSQIRDLKNIEFSLMDDFIFSLFKDYTTNIYEPSFYRKNSIGPLENYIPLEWDIDDEEDITWINAYGDLCSLPSKELVEIITPKFEKNGNLKKVLIKTPDPPYSGVRKGISEINISYDYFAGKSDIFVELNIGCHIDNLIFSEYFQEKVNYNFDSIGDLAIFIPGPKSSTVLLNDDNILVWKYFYNNDGRLCKMTLNDTKNNTSYNFIIEYQKG